MVAAVTVALRCRVQPGRWDDLVALLAEMIPYAEAPGGIHVSVLHELADPDAFVVLIGYDTGQDHRADRLRAGADPLLAGYLRRWRALLAEPPEVATYESVRTPQIR